VALYAPWHRPPEVRQAQLPEAKVMVVSPVKSPAADSSGALTARAMLDAGIDPQVVLSVLLRSGLDEQKAVGALNVALSNRR
jgi:hypothetical protein